MRNMLLSFKNINENSQKYVSGWFLGFFAKMAEFLGHRKQIICMYLVQCNLEFCDLEVHSKNKCLCKKIREGASKSYLSQLR